MQRRLALRSLKQLVELTSLQTHAPEDTALLLNQVVGRIDFDDPALVHDDEFIIVDDLKADCLSRV